MKVSWALRAENAPTLFPHYWKLSFLVFEFSRPILENSGLELKMLEQVSFGTIWKVFRSQTLKMFENGSSRHWPGSWVRSTVALFPKFVPCIFIGNFMFPVQREDAGFSFSLWSPRGSSRGPKCRVTQGPAVYLSYFTVFSAYRPQKHECFCPEASKSSYFTVLSAWYASKTWVFLSRGFKILVFYVFSAWYASKTRMFFVVKNLNINKNLNI